MREEKNKIITQWMFPTIFLVLVIAGMIISFNSRSAVMASATVSKDMVVVVERYATELAANLTAMSSMAKAMADSIHYLEENKDDAAVAKVLYSLCFYSPAYMALITNETGAAIAHTGERVNLSQVGYFSELLEIGANHFTFIEDDGFTGSRAIVFVTNIPGDSENMLITYYPIEDMGNSIMKNDLDGDILYMLLSPNGEILAHNKNYNSEFLTDNLIEMLRSGHNEEIRKMDIRLKNGHSDSMKVELNDESRSLVYTPLSINDWYVMIGVHKNYVDRQESRVWEFTRRTFFQLALVISGFAIVMVIVNMVAKIRNTSKTKELMVKADTDLLTGLLNKVATERKVMEYMEASQDDQALMFVLDIDNFKKINDTMGHAFGDEVLRSLGQQIMPIFRSTDIIGRIGGDELIILLKTINNDESLLREAEKVARFFHDFKAGEYVKYSATASIGAAIFPRDGRDFESMYKAADQALYMAKKRGKNQLAFYHDTFDAVVIKN